MLAEIIGNHILVTTLISVVLAQVLKVPIHLITDRELDLKLIFTTGGMPSSHSSFVVSLITSLIIIYGWESPYVAIAMVFGIITMYDATGIRRQAGRHAMILNVLREEISFLSRGFSGILPNRDNQREKLKEMLGHEPLEVVAGGGLGATVAIVMFQYFF